MTEKARFSGVLRRFFAISRIGAGFLCANRYLYVTSSQRIGATGDAQKSGLLRQCDDLKNIGAKISSQTKCANAPTLIYKGSVRWSAQSHSEQEGYRRNKG